ncbi:hypothetical protein A2853_00615 [Candidatus Kaiserbacteria bacterium RIFCSPHIGHO2_01_FULL_55_17]|uniref:Cell division protein FtsL n=1 Tax=Candidatus Kaiserbacteria bacterium RIFCSPHIGHO2_01_FULL_55_17 TaxID=1798484 RepID=A0A1F6D7J0_9BACT|nr:MAG: hypothetical protein A2853_00615 [Candidatus Kaiserbacteria bacterium RIFCSPHIGHO2_01_FULL_55_17]
MWTRNQRQSATRLFLRRLGIVALFVFVIVALSGVWGVYRKERESRTLRAQAEGEYVDLAARQAQLAADIERLGSDRGREEALREQYGLAERGEGLIVIVDSVPMSPEATSTSRGWLGRLFPWW